MPAFTDLLVVVAVAFAAPFALGLFPRVRLPSVVVEIVAGIVVGPSVLGLVEVDQVIEVVALIGLGFVLFLAGLEIEFEKLRGRVLRVTALGFVLSFAIALVVAAGLSAGGLVQTPLLVAIILCATSLGVIVPVLKDSGEISSPFGQLIVAAASIADFGAIILLTLFFSGEGGIGSTLLLLGALVVLAAVVYATVRGAEGSMRIKGDLLRLQDTTAQVRIRAAQHGDCDRREREQRAEQQQRRARPALAGEEQRQQDDRAEVGDRGGGDDQLPERGGDLSRVFEHGDEYAE